MSPSALPLAPPPAIPANVDLHLACVWLRNYRQSPIHEAEKKLRPVGDVFPADVKWRGLRSSSRNLTPCWGNKRSLSTAEGLFFFSFFFFFHYSFCFTTIETRRLIRDRIPGRPPRPSHSSWALVVEFCLVCVTCRRLRNYQRSYNSWQTLKTPPCCRSFARHAHATEARCWPSLTP